MLSSTSYEGGCVNCHSFCPEQSRQDAVGRPVGQIRHRDSPGRRRVVTGSTPSFGYTSWHPSGRLAVYAVNKIPMFFHSARNEVRKTRPTWIPCWPSIVASRAGSRWSRSWPRRTAWRTGPCGRATANTSISAPLPSSGRPTRPSRRALYDRVRYDLARIAYDSATDTSGRDRDGALRPADRQEHRDAARQSGRLPLALLLHVRFRLLPELEAGERLVSDRSWGPATGRTVPIPTSPRSTATRVKHGRRGRTTAGGSFSAASGCTASSRGCSSATSTPSATAGKPFVLPQEDPHFYESCLLVFNTPELVTGPPRVVGEALAGVFRRRQGMSVSLPQTMATPPAGQVPPASSWQLQRE